jgi:two-component system, LuxR family, sensor kinase FixL
VGLLGGMTRWMRLALPLVLLWVWAGPAAAAEAEAKRVLVVHSFGSTAPPFTTHSTAFEATLTKEMGERVDLDEISLDMARYAQPDMEEPFVQFLLTRLSKWQPDLVIPIGSPAGRFVSRNRNRLFPHAPVIYTGMDRRTLPDNAFDNNATFVGESFDLKGLVEDILQIAPDTSNISVVIGASPLERFWTKEFQRAFQPFADRVTFTWLNDLSFDGMLKHVAALPPRSFVLLGLLIRDASGVTHNQDEALQQLRAASSAPINGLFQNQLGLGLVGGRLYQAELEGEESARIAIRVLRGEPVSKFPPKIIPPHAPRYDWRELQRWKISESLLPPGSVVAFRQPTVWDRYRWWILGTLAVGLVQAALIAQLAIDVVKRRRTERALRESESRFRIVADSAPVLIWMSGIDTLCTFFNKPWLHFTGRTLEQELGNGWTAGIHPDDLATCLKRHLEAFETRQPFVLQYRLRRRDGEYRWVSDSGVPRYDERGQFAGYIGSCSDITERLRAEERFRQVFEAAPNAMIMVNGEGSIALVNAQAERVFGYAREELLGQSIETLIPVRVRAQHPALRREFARAPETRAMGAGRNLFGRRKDGSELPVEVGLNPISTPDGDFVVASVIDITERRKAEDEAERLRQDLAHVSRVATMGELTAAIVHEISQPLTAILSNAQAGLRSVGSGKAKMTTLGDIFQDIVAADMRANQVVRNLRSLFSKGKADNQPLQLDALIQDVLSVVARDAQRRNVDIRVDMVTPVPAVCGDRVQLQQVLLNLIVNAFDALTAVVDQPREVIVRVRRLGDDELQIDVADTGPGISSEALESLFDSFVTTKPGGMGMGLSVSRSIVRAHEGRIWAENNGDVGATFHVVLPALAARGKPS